MNTNLQLYILTQLTMVYYLFTKLANGFEHTDHHHANIQKLKMLTMLTFEVFNNVNNVNILSFCILA